MDHAAGAEKSIYSGKQGGSRATWVRTSTWERSLDRSIRTIQLGVFMVAAVSLLLELVLIRVFDVILFSNIGYMVITGAMFALGLAGVYVALRPLDESADVRKYLATVCVCKGCTRIGRNL